MLLLEVLALDVDKALKVVATGAVIDETTNAFLASKIQNQLNSEFSRWRPPPAAPHAAVLLAWSAILTLAGRHTEAQPHAAVATQADALAALRDLSTPDGLQPAAADLAGTIVFSTAATVLTAFGVDPLSMAPQQAQQAVDMLCNIFSHHPLLCAAFWADQDSLSNQPVLHFLDSLAGIFPAYPIPLLRLLTALATENGMPSLSTTNAAANNNTNINNNTAAATAAASYLYLARNTSLTWLHSLPHPAIQLREEQEGGGGGNGGGGVSVTTLAEIDLPGAPGLSLHTNVVGDVLTQLDAGSGVCGAWPAWHPSPSTITTTTTTEQAIRWYLPAEEETRPWALLCRAYGALHAVSTTTTHSSSSSNAATAFMELDAALEFLAAVCGGDAGSTAVHILKFEAPSSSSSSSGGDGAGRRDVISLACQTIAALTTPQFSTPAPPSSLSSTLTHCFHLCAAYTPVAAGRVTNELLAALGITPLDVSMAARAPAALPEAPLLRRVLLVESEIGRYPATQAFLQLLIALLQAGCPSPSLATLVSFVVQRIAPELNHYKYENPAEKWQLAERCLIVIRQALLAAPESSKDSNDDENEGGGITVALSAAVCSVLHTDSGIGACLLPLLPPDASALEAMSIQHRMTVHVEAAEKCCVAWLRLIPVLLPPWSSTTTTSTTTSPSAGVFLRGISSGGFAPPAAAILLSFLSYPYFSARERALAVRCLHCFVVAATASAPEMPLLPLLPHNGGGVLPAAKRALSQALMSVSARSCPSLFAATCDVLVAAVQHHPSLVEALLFDDSVGGQSKEEEGAARKVN